MRTERTNGTGEECQRDRDWIAANCEMFWLVATVAYEEVGRGTIMVDLGTEAADREQAFSYLAEGELEVENEDVRRLVGEYDPDREFVVVLQKGGDRTAVCRGYRPLPGWHTEMKIQTPYRAPGGEGEDIW